MNEILGKIRYEAKLSQEKFAELIGVSRQAVQKWESGAAFPGLEHLIRISEKFGVSLDALVFGGGRRVAEELAFDKKVKPKYAAIHVWESYSSALMHEYRQAEDEGKDVAAFKDLFRAASLLPAGEHKEKIADVLYEMVCEAPLRQDYPFDEPSDLEGIRRTRKGKADRFSPVRPAREKIEGAWTGRICGCLLGKPVEGISKEELKFLLKSSGNLPMRRYILSSDLKEEVRSQLRFRIQEGALADRAAEAGCAPADDDTNYTVMAQLLVSRFGIGFTPHDVSRLWLSCQPKDAYCTAERVAFLNFVNGYEPPDSAVYKNPYREWIGAQIRGDYFGYLYAGDPCRAAEAAWKDACISHVKNGIYGEMFAAAAVAAAAVSGDVRQIVASAAEQIPAASRLYAALSDVLAWHKAGLSQKACFDKIYARWDDADGYGWTHTIPNAMIVCAALIYGEGDFARSVCMAVEAGFDTDCNGATVGSVLGMMNGIQGIKKEWTAPLCGTLDTSVFGVGKVKISDLVDRTMEQMVAK